MLSDGTQRLALFLYQIKEMKILNTSFPRVEIESITTIHSYTVPEWTRERGDLY